MIHNLAGFFGGSNFPIVFGNSFHSVSEFA